MNYDCLENLKEYNERKKRGDTLTPFSVPSYDESGNEIPVLVPSYDENTDSNPILVIKENEDLRNKIITRNAITVSGEHYEEGTVQVVTVSSVPNAYEYAIYHRVFNVETRQWSDWWWDAQQSKPFSHTFAHGNIGALKRLHIQYGFKYLYPNRAVSEIIASNTYRHYGMKKWNGNSWIWGGITHKLDGNTWIDTLPKKWTGSEWQYV